MAPANTPDSTKSTMQSGSPPLPAFSEGASSQGCDVTCGKAESLVFSFSFSFFDQESQPHYFPQPRFYYEKGMVGTIYSLGNLFQFISIYWSDWSILFGESLEALSVKALMGQSRDISNHHLFHAAGHRFSPNTAIPPPTGGVTVHVCTWPSPYRQRRWFVSYPPGEMLDINANLCMHHVPYKHKYMYPECAWGLNYHIIALGTERQDQYFLSLPA